MLLLFIIILPISILSQWTEKTFPTNEDLNIVRFITPEIGWAVGRDHLFQTLDGGLTWATKDSSYNIWKGFQVLDDSTIIMGDYTEGIKISENGGNSWVIIDSTIKDVNSFQFLNPEFGFAAGGGRDTTNVYRTLDSGKSWQRIAHFSADSRWADFSKVSFIDFLLGWAVTYSGKIFHTTNGGFNWEFQDSSAKIGIFVPLRDIQFTTADSGWAIGGISGNSIILRTTDGGATWISWRGTSIPPDVTIASLKEISMINSKVGWIVGSSNGPAYILRTSDGGTTWNDETPENNFLGIESITMINNLEGFAVGQEGKFYKTVNGGEITDVENKSALYDNYTLDQNYPNPFNPTTTIKYSVPSKEKSETVTGETFMELNIYDVLGRKVSTLVNQKQKPGNYKVTWDGSNYPSGVYFYKLKTESYISTKKMILLK